MELAARAKAPRLKGRCDGGGFVSLAVSNAHKLHFPSYSRHNPAAPAKPLIYRTFMPRPGGLGRTFRGFARRHRTSSRKTTISGGSPAFGPRSRARPRRVLAGVKTPADGRRREPTPIAAGPPCRSFS